MTCRRHSQGFTLVEVMIVVGIIAILSALAIPHFAKMRKEAQRVTCVTSLRLMAGAKQMAAMDNRWLVTDSSSTIGNPFYKDTISSYMRQGVRPVCPTGARCYYNGLNTSPTCQSAIPTHVYEAE